MSDYEYYEAPGFERDVVWRWNGSVLEVRTDTMSWRLSLYRDPDELLDPHVGYPFVVERFEP